MTPNNQTNSLSKRKVRRDLRSPSAVEEVGPEEQLASRGGQREPTHWQYRCLRLQESIPATFLVCLVVVAERLFVTPLEDGTASKVG